MFRKMVNQAKLTFILRTQTPLLVNSGTETKLRPGYDMRPMTTIRDGKDTVFIPGSSAKGVFRSRYEQLLLSLDATPEVCNIVDGAKRCRSQSKAGDIVYRDCCPACRLFGNTSLGSRIQFSDAFPVGEVKLGSRHGVGIDRITGAAFGSAKFEYQMVEDAQFAFVITFQNYALYQLRIILWVLEQVDQGFVAFGMGTSRGNGRMRLADGATMQLRCEQSATEAGGIFLRGYHADDKGPALNAPKCESSLLGTQITIEGQQPILEAIGLMDRASIQEAMASENRKMGYTS